MKEGVESLKYRPGVAAAAAKSGRNRNVLYKMDTLTMKGLQTGSFQESLGCNHGQIIVICRKIFYAATELNTSPIDSADYQLVAQINFLHTGHQLVVTVLSATDNMKKQINLCWS